MKRRLINFAAWSCSLLCAAGCLPLLQSYRQSVAIACTGFPGGGIASLHCVEGTYTLQMQEGWEDFSGSPWVETNWSLMGFRYQKERFVVTHAYQLDVPFAWWVALTGAFPAAVFLQRRMHRGPSGSGTNCPTCGYDLRATPNRCPECGTVPPSMRNSVVRMQQQPD